MPMQLVGKPEHSSPGDFKAEVVGNSLLLAQDVVVALERIRVRSVEQLASCLLSFPSSVATIMRWQASEVLSASERLIRILRGKIPDEFLDAGEPQTRPYGAFYPNGCETKSTSKDLR